MGFEFGLKGFTFSMIAAICWIASILLSFLDLTAINWILSIGVLVFGIMGFVTSKKELAVDPANSKAKTGKIIGLIIIILEIVSVIAIFALAGLLVGALAA